MSAAEVAGAAKEATVARMTATLEALEALCANADAPWVSPRGVVHVDRIRALIKEGLSSD